LAPRTGNSLWQRIDPGTIVAFLALVLTQLPPISEIIYRAVWPAKVTVSFSTNEFIVDQIFGHSVVVLQLSLRNDGGRVATIGQLSAVLSGPAGFLTALSADEYISIGPQMMPVAQPMTSIVLELGKRWDAMVLFEEKISADEQSKIVRIEGSLMPGSFGPPSLIPQPPQAPLQPKPILEKEAFDMANGAFKWERGDYELFIQVLSEGGTKEIGLTGLTFTVSSAAISQLQSVINMYQSGILNEPGNPGTGAMVRLHVLNATDASEKLGELPTPPNSLL